LTVETEPTALLARELLVEAAREAGALALGFFRLGARTAAEVHTKSGGSPVTAADYAADALLKDRLERAFPEAGWLSEETADDVERLDRRSLLVVDPIDGTRAFVAGDPRWAVSAALVRDGRPVAGVIHAPALGETYAAALDRGATLNGGLLSRSARPDAAPLRGAGPKPILAGMERKLGGVIEIAPKIPSLAYRFCLAARGELDFAVASPDSHDWDIAAADLVLAETGRRLVGAEGRPLAYNRADVRRKALLAAPESLAPRLLEAFRAAIGG
jgi:myo-inositol-1(or 4)-monophosphatase